MGEDRFVGIDPGNVKCGYAVLSERRERLALEVIRTGDLLARAAQDVETGVAIVCVGDATTSRRVVEQLRARWPDLPVALVDERDTSFQARRRYYEDHPPQGMWRFLPRGLLVPKEPLDGYAALLILERYLSQQSGTPPRAAAKPR